MYSVLGTFMFHFSLIIHRKYRGKKKNKQSQNKRAYEIDEASQTWRTQNPDLQVAFELVEIINLL